MHVMKTFLVKTQQYSACVFTKRRPLLGLSLRIIEKHFSGFEKSSFKPDKCKTLYLWNLEKFAGYKNLLKSLI